MADTKISALTAGAPAVATDVLPIQRGAGNNSLLVSDIRDLITGSTVANGATVTTSNPVLNLSQTWNAGAVTFTGIKCAFTNTASATGSKMLDFQLGGSTLAQLNFSGDSGGVNYNDTEFRLTNTGNTAHVAIQYGASAGWVVRSYSGTTARGSLVLSTLGSATLQALNSQLLTLSGGGGIRLSNGTANIDTTITTGIWQIPAAIKTLSTTVAALPAAGTAGSGARAFVTDATATTFLSTVAGGGANKVPVVSDGTNWLIG